MKRYFFLPFLILTLSVLAQNKLLTIEDAVVRNRTTLAPENLRQLQFLYGTEDYVYLKKQGDNDVWMRGNLASAQEKTFLTLDDLSQKMKLAGFDALTAMPAINFYKSPEWVFIVNGT
ncbi:MAG: hypothetical protein ACXVBH_05255, partial [Flavisolibacter sp.]